jgi:hypothetical protein
MRTDSPRAVTQHDDGRVKGREPITARARGAGVPQRRPLGRGRTAAAVTLAIGVSVLAACGTSAGGTADRAIAPSTQATSAAAGRSELSVGQPAVIRGGIVAKGPASPTHKTEPHKLASTTAPASAAPGARAGGQGADPSGESPLTTLSGFSLKYVQDFNGNSLPNNWYPYHGTPGGLSSDVSQWVPSMCTFSGGEAHFIANGIDSCGLEYFGSPQTYGAWFARLKADSQPSSLFFSNIFLLWPENNQWPPEIDIYEDGGIRNATSNTVYDEIGSACGSDPSSQCLHTYVQSNGSSGGVANSDTEWHTYGVEWTPSGVTWLIDGRVVYTASAGQVQSPATLPDQPMYMDLQSENLQGGGTPGQRETMSVDWVAQFGWNG